MTREPGVPRDWAARTGDPDALASVRLLRVAAAPAADPTKVASTQDTGAAGGRGPSPRIGATAEGTGAASPALDHELVLVAYEAALDAIASVLCPSLMGFLA